jgi:DNA processing protein
LTNCAPAYFSCAPAEPPARALHDYVVAHGPMEAVERIRDSSAPAPVLAEIIRFDPDITDDLHAIDSGLARLVTPGDDDWPSSQLNELGVRGLGAPLALWVRGQTSLAGLVRTAVTITGSRAATSYGAHVAADFSYNLARAAVTVVGGGAYGVEASAHRGALAGDGPTVVVLACGVDVAYPNGSTSLFDTIVSSGGLLVSEYPLGMHPTRERFVVRSRLLAALSTATVVVEAGVRSGALAVAKLANELHRQVYAVPGPITSAQSVGVLELLRTGQARAIGSVEHITEVETRP